MGSNLIRRLAAPDSLLPNSHFPHCWVSRMLQNPIATHHVRTSKWNSRIEAKTFPKTRQVTTSLDLPLLTLSFTTLVLEKGNFFNNIVIPLLEQYYYSRIHVIVSNSFPFQSFTCPNRNGRRKRQVHRREGRKQGGSRQGTKIAQRKGWPTGTWQLFALTFCWCTFHQQRAHKWYLASVIAIELASWYEPSQRPTVLIHFGIS